MASQGSPADVADSSVKNIIDAYKQSVSYGGHVKPLTFSDMNICMTELTRPRNPRPKRLVHSSRGSLCLSTDAYIFFRLLSTSLDVQKK